ncbi:sensor histidine kinase [Calothrix sp. PCC 6303]|uniref:sensor histidine kinase n=1 Tax=Calothrix sp. PCC 6303 TaxID=1170562 RepID=UPI00059FA949|nr:HAMP domain-containing sensor histidine kinase [Calothrix sp. PCC 6303]
MFQATRRRLAIWYTSITALLLLLFAIGVYLYVRSTLIERVDDTLNHVVEIVERCLTNNRCASTLVIEPGASNTGVYRINLEASFGNNADNVEDDHIDLEWFSPTGELIWSTFSVPLDIPIHPNRTGETVHIFKEELGNQKLELAENIKSYFDTSSTSYRLRQITQRVQRGRQVLGYLRVSHPWFEVTKPSIELIVDLGLGIGIMVISVAASGWFLSGKAMEPVHESYLRLKQFTADASHELRSPIALIQTNVQIALTDLEISENEAVMVSQYRQQLLVVERLTKRLGKLVSDLLFLARQDGGVRTESFSPCPIDALLMEVVEEQKLFAAEKNISLTLKLADPPESEIDPELLENWFTPLGDWDQLVRLFTNLIGNALRYTPSGGKVKVELARPEVLNRVSGLRYGNSQLQIRIEDSGIGIPAEAIPLLFNRFYRVDPARTHSGGNQATEKATGSGLGLAIASAIVDNHHGQIQVESTLGVGTVFTVILPLMQE